MLAPRLNTDMTARAKSGQNSSTDGLDRQASQNPTGVDKPASFDGRQEGVFFDSFGNNRNPAGESFEAQSQFLNPFMDVLQEASHKNDYRAAQASIGQHQFDSSVNIWNHLADNGKIQKYQIETSRATKGIQANLGLPVSFNHRIHIELDPSQQRPFAVMVVPLSHDSIHPSRVPIDHAFFGQSSKNRLRNPFETKFEPVPSQIGQPVQPIRQTCEVSKQSAPVLGDVRAFIDWESRKNLVLQVESSMLVSELNTLAIQQLSSPFTTGSKVPGELDGHSLYFGDLQLDTAKRLRDYGIFKREVRLSLKSLALQESTAGEESILANPTHPNSAIFSSNTYLPKLTKPGYVIEPSLEKMASLQEKELAEVEYFKIKNRWGEITFPSKTDIRGLDLDQIVVIEKGLAELYPKRRMLPPLGSGLNKAALVTLFGFKLKAQQPLEDWLQRFRQTALKKGAKYVCHDVERDAITFQVEGSQ